MPLCCLPGDPAREDHELALFIDPGAEHVAFRGSTVQQLRALYTNAKQRGLEIPYVLDSSFAIAFFLRDPEGSAVEIYVARSKPGNDQSPLNDPRRIDRLILGSYPVHPVAICHDTHGPGARHRSPADNGTHHNRFLQAGDVIEAEITGVVRHRNRCIRASEDHSHGSRTAMTGDTVGLDEVRGGHAR